MTPSINRIACLGITTWSLLFLPFFAVERLISILVTRLASSSRSTMEKIFRDSTLRELDIAEWNSGEETEVIIRLTIAKEERGEESAQFMTYDPGHNYLQSANSKYRLAWASPKSIHNGER